LRWQHPLVAVAQGWLATLVCLRSKDRDSGFHDAARVVFLHNC